MQKFKSVEELVSQLKPEKPVYCLRKKSILSASKFFQNNFPGKILYAVKTNPHSEVIKTLIKSGLNRDFDRLVFEIDFLKSKSIKMGLRSVVDLEEGVRTRGALLPARPETRRWCPPP